MAGEEVNTEPLTLMVGIRGDTTEMKLLIVLLAVQEPLLTVRVTV